MAIQPHLILTTDWETLKSNSQNAIKNAYDKAVEKGATLSQDKTLTNLANTINTITIPTIAEKHGIITPAPSQQIVLPDSGIDGMSSVTIDAASYKNANDTGWQILYLTDSYQIPVRTNIDLSEALTIDISALTFHPRLILFEPATNAQAVAVTAPDETYHRFLFSMNELSESGDRVTEPGFACIFLETSDVARKAINTVGFYPDSDWNVLRLVQYSSNSTISQIRVKKGNWRWRGIG